MLFAFANVPYLEMGNTELPQTILLGSPTESGLGAVLLKYFQDGAHGTDLYLMTDIELGMGLN